MFNHNKQHIGQCTNHTTAKLIIHAHTEIVSKDSLNNATGQWLVVQRHKLWKSHKSVNSRGMSDTWQM